MRDIRLNDYDYDLPADRIAQYPVAERDLSQLLIYKDERIGTDKFRHIDNYIPAESLLVFNNTRVIRARILFQKDTGASIEILCLEPLFPVDYELSFTSAEPVEWKCIVGNLKKWKSGIISIPFIFNGIKHDLKAERLKPEGEAWRIRFTWNCCDLSFGQVLEAVGHIPLPPYINRNDEADDSVRYQTVYSRIKGSVAAPTAGLHFTDKVFSGLKKKGINCIEITLHVGAGTFKPVKTDTIADHEMHCEHFFVTKTTIELLIKKLGSIIAVGTTSVRTLESLYWLGVKISADPLLFRPELTIGQWEPYEMTSGLPVKDSLKAIINYLKRNNLESIVASTSIIIVPGYEFRTINGIITNFHQPRSTLLLLVSAWAGKNWEKIYKYALNNGFRFLSYGDSSLLLR